MGLKLSWIKTSLIVIILISFEKSVYCQSLGFGRCPDVEVKQDFNASRYAGRWYEAERIINTFELGGSCVRADYSLEEDSYGDPTGNILVKNTMLNWFGKQSSISGSARPLDASKDEAKFLVSFRGVPTEGSYWVLETDYYSYSVVYSCTQLFHVFNAKFIWLLTRNSIGLVSEATQNTMYEVLQNNGLSSMLLSKTSHRNCPYPT